MKHQPQTVQEIYQRHCANRPHTTGPFLPLLASLAKGLDLAVEFGCQRGASAAALLMGAKRVISYDTVVRPEARQLEQAAGDRWSYRIEDTRTADVPECDLLFIDSRHTYAQVRAELQAHAGKVRSFLAFHDVVTFGSVGADGETGNLAWQYQRGQTVPDEHLGIMPAILEYMWMHSEWKVYGFWSYSHGMLVLRRDGAGGETSSVEMRFEGGGE